MVESVRGIIRDDASYGITTVQPNRAIKKCRIRNLRIEYYLSRIAVVIVIPKSCGACEKNDECTDDFILQIMEKSGSLNADFGSHKFFMPS